jgi:AcrR family transcriptional regulator
LSRATSGARTRARPATYHHGDLPAAVLDEVRRIIREQGVSVVSIREVARRARVSHAAPSHHFGNKAGLLTAFAIQGYDRLADVVRADLEAAGVRTPPDVLAVMGQAYVRFALENPEHFGVMFPGELINQDDPEYLRATNRCYGPLMDVVTKGSAQGTLPADVKVVATAAWSLVHGLASLWLSGRIQDRTGATDARGLAKAVTELFVDKMLRRTPTPNLNTNRAPRTRNREGS